MPTPIRYAARLVGAVAAGLCLWLAFPEHDHWWLAPIGVAVLAAVTWRTRFRLGFALGLISGWAYFVPTLSWSGIYVGKLPWFALSTLEALYIAVMSGLVGWGSARLTGGRWGRAAYLLVPLGWVAQELARSTTPWGGFPWARLAFSQTSGPLLPLAQVGGSYGVTGVVATLGLLLLLVARSLSQRRFIPTALAAVMVPALVFLAPALADGRIFRDDRVHKTVWTGERIGLVQGNVPKAGLDFNAERRAVLDNHVRGTEELAEKIGTEDVSLVVWPENSSDIDPFRNSDAADQIRRAVAAVDVPLVVGAVLAEPTDHNSNVSLLYRPGGGEPERYTKLHPVPFAEYIPYRSFFRKFTSAADLAGNFVAGDTIGVFRVPGTNRDEYAVLPTICFEVAYDGLMRDALDAAGQIPSVLLVQTNNATFGMSAESEQQFAISRFRAVEFDRDVVHVSTVGVSGFITPSGAVNHKTGLFTHESEVGMVGPRTGTTLARRLGDWPALASAVAFGALLLLGAATRRRTSRDQRTTPAR